MLENNKTFTEIVYGVHLLDILHKKPLSIEWRRELLKILDNTILIFVCRRIKNDYKKLHLMTTKLDYKIIINIHKKP